MKIQLSDHFTYKKLLRFTLPSIGMMVLANLFNVIDDGFFVSNFVGKDAFVALNIMSPMLALFMALSYMLGAGGNAWLSRLLGERQEKQAVSAFSSLIYFAAIATLLLSGLCALLLKPYCALMGAEGAVYENCIKYASIALPGAIFVVLQGLLQSLLITAEKPGFAMILTIISSASNIIFDILLMVIFPLGITGAICATLSGPAISGIIAALYFASAKQSKLHFVKAKINLKEIGKISGLGVSQLITNLALSIVSMVFNAQVMRYQGNDGVAAYGVIMYLSIVFTGAFTGYSTGATSILAYHFGAKNTEELRSVYRKSLTIIGALSVLLTGLSYISAAPFAKVIVGYDPAVLEMSVYAYRIYGFSFLFAGVGVFAGAFFTALDDSFTAGAISFIRTMIFQIGTVLIMPLFWGIDGIWFAPVVAEVLAFLVAAWYLKRKRGKYGY